jgi:hypothetical protein
MPGTSLTPLELPPAALPGLFPDRSTPADELRLLLHAAVLSLSDSNVPPWRFQIDGNSADLYVDFARTWRETDPSGREMTLACGAGLSYLQAVAQRQGRGIAITPYPDPLRPDLLARVWLEPAAGSGSDATPLPAVGRERLVWETGAGPQPGDAALRALEDAVARSAAWLHLEQRPDRRAAVVGLIAESDDQHTRDPLRRRAETAHHGPDRWRLPAQPPAGRLEPFVIHPNAGRRAAAARPAPGAAGHPVFAVLGTAGDSRHVWLHAGQGLGRQLMQVRRHKILPAFRNQLIRVPELRARLGELIGRDGFPQVVLALLPDPQMSSARR